MVQPTQMVARVKSQLADVCKKRSTMHLAASLGASTSTHIQSQMRSPSTLEHLKLGLRWEQPIHFTTTEWKQISLHYIPPWHLFTLRKSSSQRTIVAHNACTFYNSRKSTEGVKNCERGWLTSSKNKNYGLFLYFCLIILLICPGKPTWLPCLPWFLIGEIPDPPCPSPSSIPNEISMDLSSN